MTNVLKQASILLIPVLGTETKLFAERKFYAVSRRGGSIDQVGFVCGKVEPGENTYEAALREASEEVGLCITTEDLGGLVCLYSAVNSGHWITSFLLRRSVPVEEIKMEAGLLPRLVTIDDMCLPKVSPFWEYNLGVRNALSSINSLL